MGKYKGRRFTTQIPATPCEPELRNRLVDFAVNNRKSLAEVMRDAIEIFLSENDSKTIKCDSKEIKESLERSVNNARELEGANGE